MSTGNHTVRPSPPTAYRANTRITALICVSPCALKIKTISETPAPGSAWIDALSSMNQLSIQLLISIWWRATFTLTTQQGFVSIDALMTSDHLAHSGTIKQTLASIDVHPTAMVTGKLKTDTAWQSAQTAPMPMTSP